MSADEAEVLRLTNVERAKKGCPALNANAALAAAARGHSQDMAEKGYFEHTSPNGSTMQDRVEAAGYRWSRIAENIAAGGQSAADTMSQWMNSSGHRANILDCALKDLGVGLYRKPGSPYGSYWTQDFGSSR